MEKNECGANEEPTSNSRWNTRTYEEKEKNVHFAAVIASTAAWDNSTSSYAYSSMVSLDFEIKKIYIFIIIHVFEILTVT